MGIRVRAEPQSPDSGLRRGEGRSLRPVRPEAGGGTLRARRTPTAIPGAPRTRMSPDCHRSEAWRSGSDACTHRLVAASHCCARARSRPAPEAEVRGCTKERGGAAQEALPRSRRRAQRCGRGSRDWFQWWAEPVGWHTLRPVLAMRWSGSCEKRSPAFQTRFVVVFKDLFTGSDGARL